MLVLSLVYPWVKGWCFFVDPSSFVIPILFADKSSVGVIVQFYFVALGVSPFISAKKLFTFQKNYLLHSERLQFYFIFISNTTPSSLILKSFNKIHVFVTFFPRLSLKTLLSPHSHWIFLPWFLFYIVLFSVKISDHVTTIFTKVFI